MEERKGPQPVQCNEHHKLFLYHCSADNNYYCEECVSKLIGKEFVHLREYLEKILGGEEKMKSELVQASSDHLKKFAKARTQHLEAMKQIGEQSVNVANTIMEMAQDCVNRFMQYTEEVRRNMTESFTELSVNCGEKKVCVNSMINQINQKIEIISECLRSNKYNKYVEGGYKETQLENEAKQKSVKQNLEILDYNMQNTYLSKYNKTLELQVTSLRKILLDPNARIVERAALAALPSVVHKEFKALNLKVDEEMKNSAKTNTNLETLMAQIDISKTILNDIEKSNEIALILEEVKGIRQCLSRGTTAISHNKEEFVHFDLPEQIEYNIAKVKKDLFISQQPGKELEQFFVKSEDKQNYIMFDMCEPIRIRKVKIWSDGYSGSTFWIGYSSDKSHWENAANLKAGSGWSACNIDVPKRYRYWMLMLKEYGNNPYQCVEWYKSVEMDIKFNN